MAKVISQLCQLLQLITSVVREFPGSSGKKSLGRMNGIDRGRQHFPRKARRTKLEIHTKKTEIYTYSAFGPSRSLTMQFFQASHWPTQVTLLTGHVTCVAQWQRQVWQVRGKRWWVTGAIFVYWPTQVTWPTGQVTRLDQWQAQVWQVTCDTWQMTHDTWYMICGTWHDETSDRRHIFILFCY